jgi:hypothetical protein
MADIKVKLSEAGFEGRGMFHDWEFWAPDSNRGANGDIERYTVTNKSGNALFVRVKLLGGEEQLLAVEELEFTLKGGIEHNDFSTFLELVEKAREVHGILNGDKHGKS